MQLLTSTLLLLMPLVLAQAPPNSPCTISNPATGLFFDLEHPSAEFSDGVVGREGTGGPSQVWRLTGPSGNLICNRTSLTPLAITSAGREGEALDVFFKAWATINATAVGEGLFTLNIDGFFVTAGVPDGSLTLESPDAGPELQEWLFTEVSTDAQ